MRLAVTLGMRTAAGGSLGGKRFARALSNSGRGDTVTAMAHGLGGQIALVHAFRAVLARRAAILVDTFGLALAAAHTGTARSQRRSADGRHFLVGS